MKSLFLLLLIPFISYSQESLNRDLTLSVLDAYFKENKTIKQKFQSTLENSLNWEIDMPIEATMQEIESREIKDNLKNSSEDIIYVSLLRLSKIKIYETMTQECNYKYILFKVLFTTKDFEQFSYMYYIDMKDLLNISDDITLENLKDITKNFNN